MIALDGIADFARKTMSRKMHTRQNIHEEDSASLGRTADIHLRPEPPGSPVDLFCFLSSATAPTLGQIPIQRFDDLTWFGIAL